MKAKNAFLTEGFWNGKIPRNHADMRNDSAWMHIFDADHTPIIKYAEVKDYDNVFVMFPKGFLSLNAEGSKISNQKNPYSELLSVNIIGELKKQNKKVHYIQEGPCWLFNDYEIADQFNFYNMLTEADTIFAHNQFDTKFYEGLLSSNKVETLPPVMIEDLLSDIVPQKQDKVIVGGNFARWYGGFQSYMVADAFHVEKWTQNSHAKREHEDAIPDLQHLPRLNWLNWMSALSTFKYAVHLMPTAAAGTFNMNCAYFGIPCIGNIKVDTQNICHPQLSVDVEDIKKAVHLANKLSNDKDFYLECSLQAKQNYELYYKEEVFKKRFKDIIGSE